MNFLKHLCFRFSGSVLALVLTSTLVGCSGEGDDGGSGGSNSLSGGSEAGGMSSSGGDAGTGGETGDGPIFGDPCAEDSECPNLGEFAGNCKTNWPGGACSAGCNFAGDCGVGNVCHMGLHSCVKACDNDDDCREGYRCYDDFGGCEPAI